MILVLTIESTTHPQVTSRFQLDDGECVIGRAPDAHWRIEDPDNFVSRRHCVVAARGGRFTVTDTSSGGVFLDDSSRPLGSGVTADLRDGMRLRIGDIVLRAAIRADARPVASPGPREAARPGDPFDRDAFFAVEPDRTPPTPRPRDLPPRFEEGRGTREQPPAPERRGLPQFDDPLTLDPVLVPRRETRDVGFDWDLEPPEPPPPPSRVRERPPPAADFDWGASAPLPDQRLPDQHLLDQRPPDQRPAHQPPPGQPPSGRTPPRSGPDGGARPEAAAGLEAFLRGLGLDPADLPAILADGDAEARLEALGRDYRQMVTGLMQLLRMRAQEKGKARLSQTVVGAAANNPLKFMPDATDALAVMLAPRSPGFTSAERAIAGAVQDLARHQLSAWQGIQAALRRMVDRFDPKLIEAEVEKLGLLETLLAGGRKAKLWELYEKRFAEIARSAETRFLGEVGADFRDAYENEDKRS